MKLVDNAELEPRRTPPATETASGRPDEAFEVVWPRRFGIAPLRARLGDEVDEALCDVLTSRVSDPIWQLVDRGGGRWRTAVSRHAFLACGGRPPAPDRVCQVAELLHTGSLVIDDIQDGATNRRGGPAAHVAHGVPAALNAANAAYFHAFAILREALPRERRLRALDMLADELVTAHLGQALDLSLGARAAGGGLRTAHYLALARAKTGALVRIAARLGAIAAGASEDDEAALAAWAGEVGVAYQIGNDLADLSGSMADVAAGRPTHPLLLALERGGRAGTVLRRLLGTGSLAEADVQALRRALDAAGIARESRRAARAAAERALAALSRLPASEARAGLARMTADLAGT